MSKLNSITLYEHLLRKKNTHRQYAANGALLTLMEVARIK